MFIAHFKEMFAAYRLLQHRYLRQEILEPHRRRVPNNPSPGRLIGAMLVSGEVELGVQQIPELIFVSGVELVGTLAGDLQTNVVASTKEPTAARALITFLHSSEAMEIIKANGLDPS